MKALLACLALLAAGVACACPAAAQQIDATGVAIKVAPELEGHTLIVKDAEGKELDRIDELSVGETYEFTFPAGNYDIRLPGLKKPFEVAPGQVDLFTLGFAGETVEAGYVLSSGAKPLEPNGGEVYFALEPPGVRPPPGQ